MKTEKIMKYSDNKKPQMMAPRAALIDGETRIGRIFKDISYPCASALSAQSMFYRNSVIINEDNKPQMNADERRYFLASDFTKIIHRKGRKERKVHRMISFGSRKTTESAMNLRYVDEHEKNNELVRTKTNSGGVSSYRVRCVRGYFFSYQGTEDTENKNKTLSPLCFPWLNNLAGVNYGGLNARELEYSIFAQGETIEGGNLA